MKTLSLEEKLFLDGFRPDQESHLAIKDPRVCLDKCTAKWCTFTCPVRTYRWEQDHISIFFEGCVECGTCRVSCEFGNIEWRYPRGGFGVTFKYG
jgi:ferredoxin like protein